MEPEFLTQRVIVISLSVVCCHLIMGKATPSVSLHHMVRVLLLSGECSLMFILLVIVTRRSCAQLAKGMSGFLDDVLMRRRVPRQHAAAEAALLVG